MSDPTHDPLVGADRIDLWEKTDHFVGYIIVCAVIGAIVWFGLTHYARVPLLVVAVTAVTTIYTACSVTGRIQDHYARRHARQGNLALCRAVEGGSAGSRISDVDRDAVAEFLGACFAEGYLDQAEHGRRLASVYAATIRRDLCAVTEDLPL